MRVFGGVGGAEEQFDAFVRRYGERLTRALVAAYGPVDGSDAAQAALCYGWENWSRVQGMSNAIGYLYRVGQTEARRTRTKMVVFDTDALSDDRGQPDFEPGLIDGLRSLSESQRMAVVLVHGHGYRLVEVAGLLEISVSTLRNHLRRGLEKLRLELGVEHVA